MDITDMINTNGSITIDNISDYVLKFEDNKLTFNIKYSSINDSNNVEFTGSTILECIVKKDDIIVSNNPKKYANLWSDVLDCCELDYIKKKYKDLKSFNFDTNERIKDWAWQNKHKFAYRRKNANGVIKEIFNIIRETELQIDIKIKLDSSKILHYRVIK